MTDKNTNPVSKIQMWIGHVLTGLIVIFLAMDSIVKFINPAPVVEASAKFGLPPGEAFTLGIILLTYTVIYAIPLTSILGAILLTGYLGGAAATQLRVNEPLFSILFPVLMGIAIWAGLYLRDARLRSLIPIRTTLRSES